VPVMDLWGLCSSDLELQILMSPDRSLVPSSFDGGATDGSSFHVRGTSAGLLFSRCVTRPTQAVTVNDENGSATTNSANNQQVRYQDHPQFCSNKCISRISRWYLSHHQAPHQPASSSASTSTTPSSH
jgi:hypothetical protein